MDKPTITTGLDWLRFSMDWADDDPYWERMVQRATMPRKGWAMTGERRRGAKGYNLALPLTAGTAHVHTERREQKIGIELTGAALEEMRRLKINDDRLLRHMAALAAKPSRLDFAIDIKNVLAKPFDMYDAWEQERLRTRVKRVTCFSSSERDKNGDVSSAETVYFGATSSHQKIRIYDKAKQLGMKGLWTRVEVCFRKRRACDIFEGMLLHGIEPIGREAITSIIGCEDVEWWNQAMTGPSAAVTKTPRKDTKTARWLREDVLPVLLRVCVEEHERGEYTTWRLYLESISRMKADLGLGQKTGLDKS